jgi:hypothetical protein
MVLWVKSPRVASSDCASNPMPILIRLKAPAHTFHVWIWAKIGHCQTKLTGKRLILNSG